MLLYPPVPVVPSKKPRSIPIQISPLSSMLIVLLVWWKYSSLICFSPSKRVETPSKPERRGGNGEQNHRKTWSKSLACLSQATARACPTFKPLIRCAGPRHELSKPEESPAGARSRDRVGPCGESEGLWWPTGTLQGHEFFSGELPGYKDSYRCKEAGCRRHLFSSWTLASATPPNTPPPLPDSPHPLRLQPDCWIVSRCRFFFRGSPNTFWSHIYRLRGSNTKGRGRGGHSCTAELAWGTNKEI